MYNAEASSSKAPAVRSAFLPRRPPDAVRRGDGTIGLPRTVSRGSSRRTPSASGVKSPSGEVRRRVRTVPPSAAFDPPTPPSPSHPAAETIIASPDDSANPPESHHRKRWPRRHLHYDSSESSSDEEHADSSEDEPPWWTFTQRGMAKMRARTMRRHDNADDSHGVSGAESGRESAREGPAWEKVRFTRRRRSLQEGEGPPSSFHRGSRKSEQHMLDPAAPIRLRAGSHFPNPSALLWRRSGSRDVPPIAVAPPMIRSTSAPATPVVLDPSQVTNDPTVSSMIGADTDDQQSDPATLTKPDRPISAIRPILSPKRQLTAPIFPRFLRRGDQDVHTDTETASAPLPRVKQREKMRQNQEDQSSTQDRENSVPDAGMGTPSRNARRRRPTQLLRLNLPEQFSQHFTEGWQRGWPHPGSWQDAYYGHYADQSVDPNLKPKSKGRSSSLLQGSEPEAGTDGPTRQRDTAIPSDHSVLGSSAKTPPDTATRRKSRRARRYRQALAPPTPGGLGFTPDGAAQEREAWKEGRVGTGASGFNWSNGSGPAQTRIEEDDELARADTRVTNEKSSAGDTTKKRKWWRFGKGSKSAEKGRYDEVPWERKLRRMLFLDARVTIYIRLINLAIVIVSLALAVRIRLELDQLLLPGLVGSSTTILIAFASLTILHVLLAIYREYFGKPIGLWGLRSKMLWVCLDLLFIALWSAAVSVSINDYISTGLQCTASTPWWRGGLAASYGELLELLDSQSVEGHTINVTSADMIAHTLGIILPAEITDSRLADQICDKQVGSIVLAFITLVLYTVNMVLSLFRIFETVRRTANVDRAVMV